LQLALLAPDIVDTILEGAEGRRADAGSAGATAAGELERVTAQIFLMIILMAGSNALKGFPVRK
jgi:hypothetical protein